MLKNVRLHIFKDEEKQAQIEKYTAELIDRQYKKNLFAFRQFIPSLIANIQKINNDNISIICNKNGQFNLVDYGIGRTLYGLDPEAEISKQYLVNSTHSIFVDLKQCDETNPAEVETNESLEGALANTFSYQHYIQRSALPETIDTLVVLGVGLGFHIVELIKKHSITNLVIYEPEAQYFKCSVFCSKWNDVLAEANDKGTRLFFQLEKDGRNIVSDIEELRQHFDIGGFYLYKHYNSPIFDTIEKTCIQGGWARLKSTGITSYKLRSPTEYVPPWTQSIQLENYQDPSAEAQGRLKSNLAAFKKYFPDIFNSFSHYEPQTWLPVEDSNGEINLVKKDSLVSWYGESPKQECALNFDSFSDQPNKDGLILGYKGKKLKKYIHYQFVNKTESLLKQVEQDEGQLPDTLKSMILFGVGVGYQIERLFNNHDVEKLFVCEPNKDFFYASLFAIKWDEILSGIDEKEGRLYINIGDDGTNLFKDLLNQFYSIGPYILANTYFYQSYYNSALVSAIAQLREQLQVVISMGEYFDHARYGISHTTEALKRGFPLLRNKPAQYLSFENKEVPVFIVGNGPSLDSAIETILEYRENAIVVSCGTALSALYKHDITPDFHAEIEQNRSTFDWCSRVDDFNYLKQINLISVNGIHPDTCDLFNDVYIAFKDGESSTVSALEVLGRANYEELRFAFPTVSNLAINLFSKIGMDQIYLFGVDLGFYDKTKHHSKESSYYVNGKEVYDYEASNNTSIVVPGNFRATVFTKYEFKLSKTIIEQSLAQNGLTCFNCSDGAKIAGATPLPLDMVLISASSSQRDAALDVIKNNAFQPIEKPDEYPSLFNARFDVDALKDELSIFMEKVKVPFSSNDEADEFIKVQKEMIFESYQMKKSLLFYLLYGTINYANAVFSKLSSTTDRLTALDEARLQWLDTLEKVSISYIGDASAFDTTSSCVFLRESVFIKAWITSGDKTFSLDIEETDKKLVETIDSALSLAKTPKSSECDAYHIHFRRKVTALDSLLSNIGSEINSLVGTFSLVEESVVTRLFELKSKVSIYIWYSPNALDIPSFEAGDRPFVHTAKQHFVPGFLCNQEDVFMFLPKYEFTNSSAIQKQRYLAPLLESLSWVEEYIEYARYIAIPRKGVLASSLACDNIGNRGKVCRGNIQIDSLLLEDANETRVKNMISDINA